MDLCIGDVLFDKMIEPDYFTEVQAAIVMQQITRAIHYMHESHICHRDLKPENFLFVTKDPLENNTLKIIDFGIATIAGNVGNVGNVGDTQTRFAEVKEGNVSVIGDVGNVGDA